MSLLDRTATALPSKPRRTPASSHPGGLGCSTSCRRSPRPRWAACEQDSRRGPAAPTATIRRRHDDHQGSRAAIA
jgi:hypothetical protein